MWPFVLKFLYDRAGEGSSVPTRLVLALWAPYFKEIDSNLWGVMSVYRFATMGLRSLRGQSGGGGNLN